MDLLPVARQTLFSSISDGVLIFDEQHRLVDANSCGSRIFGFSPAEDTGKPASELFAHVPELVTHFDTPDPVSFDFQTTAGGTLTYWETIFQPIASHDSPTPGGTILIFRDVTKRHRAEEQLRESETRYRFLLDSAPFPAFIVDHENHTIALANPQGLKWSGWSTEDIVGKPAIDFYANPAERTRSLELLQKQGEFHGLEVRLKRAGGRNALTLMSGRVITWLGRKAAFISFVDITAMREAEKSLQAIELKNQELMVAEEEKQRIGRDLHDSVGQLLTGTSMLFRKVHEQFEHGETPQNEQLSTISKHLRQAIMEIRQLVHGLNPLELHGEGLWNAIFSLTRTIRENHAMQALLIPDSPVSINRPTIALQLWRITQEGVQNVLKHAKARQVTISLLVEGSTGRLEIRDDGCGFSSADRSSTPQGKGQSIMLFRANLIGGVLTVDSAPHQGTLLQCVFPLNDEQNRPGPANP